MATPERVLISTATAASDSTIEFTGLNGTYEEYEFHVIDARVTTDLAFFHMRVSTDGGSTWESGATDYWRLSVSENTVIANTAASTCEFSDGTVSERIGNASGEGYSCIIHIFCVDSSTAKKIVIGESAYIDQGTTLAVTSACDSYDGVAAIDAVQFIPTTGTSFVTGEFKLYGVN